MWMTVAVSAAVVVGCGDDRAAVDWHVYPDCKADHAPRPERDGQPMCRIGGGVVLRDARRSFKGKVEPARLVWLQPYLIDQYEVSVGQYLEFINELGGQHKCGGARGDRCFADIGPELGGKLRKVGNRWEPIPGYQNFAMDRVSFQGAQRYCEWAGKRLPTDAEWQKAALHEPYTGKRRRYAWGDEFEPGRANCEEDVCQDGFVGPTPVRMFDGTSWWQDGRSAFGLYGTMGNAREPIGECLFLDQYPCRERFSRGGGWTAGKLYLRKPFPDLEGVMMYGVRCARSLDVSR